MSFDIYVMNLMKDTDRLLSITTQLKALGFNDHKIFRTNKPTTKDIKMLHKQKMISWSCVPSRYRDHFRPGEVGHYVAFSRILNEIRKNKTGVTMILEDDALLPASFRKDTDRLMRYAPDDWDIISMSWAKSGINEGESVGKSGIRIPRCVGFFERQGIFIGTECLMVRNSSCERILKKMFPMMLQTDKFLDMLKNIGYINLYVPKRSITSQIERFVSNIQKLS